MPPGVRFLPDPRAAAEPNYDLHATVDFWLARALDEVAYGGVARAEAAGVQVVRTPFGSLHVARPVRGRRSGPVCPPP